MIRLPRLRLLGGFALALILGYTAGGSQADVVIFKDGFMVQGKVTKKGTVITDSASGQSVYAQTGPFYVDDNVRKITFSFTQVQAAEKKEVEGDPVTLTMGLGRTASFPPNQIINILKTSPWDRNWRRKVTVQSPINGQLRTVEVEQRLGLLTPQFARIDALKYNWSPWYQTLELGIDDVRGLLEDFRDPKVKDEPDGPERRFKIARFLRQAGWYKQAEDELAKLLADFPDEKQRVTEAREQIRGLKLLQAVDDLEAAQRARRHVWLQQQLAIFPKEGAEEAIQVRLRALATKYEFSNDALREARTFLNELPLQLKEPATKALFADAATKILEELNEDNVGRLEPFRSFARQRKREGEADQTPEQLLSLAVTGWLLGKDAAEAKVEVARRAWVARDVLLKYLMTHDREVRERMLADYQQKKEDALAFDELAQMVNQLPPPEPEKLTSVNPLELSAPNFAGRKNGQPYLLQVPPEYHHGRAYPVLIALHQVGEGPKEMLTRCSALALRHGYLLAVPEWSGGSTVYHYSPEEHAAVANVLRDLRRRFNVDSDRVFLLGVGEGGAMAIDVGLGHPDLFAGVVAVSAVPNFFSLRYSGAEVGNGQNLPFYVVHGTLAGEQLLKNTSTLFHSWIPQGYPSLHVEYKDRGLEWFGVELLPIFDWMNRKKRATGYPSVGRHHFMTMRETDHSFYWLTTDAIRSANLNEARGWKSGVSGARLHGRIAEGNQVVVDTRGLNRVTVWLARDAVDFSKPVTFRVQGAQGVSRTVKPSLATLLEDLYQRGDRQHLFLAKETFDLK